MPENEAGKTQDAQAQSAEQDVPAETKMEKFERERLSRRAALRKMGVTSGLALFAMFSVDDLARLVGREMKRRIGDSEIANQIAEEFSKAGIAMAGGPSCSLPCGYCAIQYETPCKQNPGINGSSNPVECCQVACQNCCTATPSNATPCGARPDAVIAECQQQCADLFGSGV